MWLLQTSWNGCFVSPVPPEALLVAFPPELLCPEVAISSIFCICEHSWWVPWILSITFLCFTHGFPFSLGSAKSVPSSPFVLSTLLPVGCGILSSLTLALKVGKNSKLILLGLLFDKSKVGYSLWLWLTLCLLCEVSAMGHEKTLR